MREDAVKFAESRTDGQLAVLAKSGRPGYKEAAVAGDCAALRHVAKIGFRNTRKPRKPRNGEKLEIRDIREIRRRASSRGCRDEAFCRSSCHDAYRKNHHAIPEIPILNREDDAGPPECC